MPIRRHKKYRKISKFIKSAVSVHDRTQFETIFDFTLQPKNMPKQDWEGIHSYEVDTFLFFPQQMRISPETYAKNLFFEDIRPTVRLQEPKFGFKVFIGDADEKNGEKSPIRRIRNFVSGYCSGSIRHSQAIAIDDARIFGCSYVSYLNSRVERLIKKVNKAKLSSVESKEASYRKLSTQISVVLQRSWDLTREWRSMLGDLQSVPEDVLCDLKLEVALVDEYCTYFFRGILAKLMLMLESLPESPCKARYFDSVLRKIKIMVRFDRWYSSRRGYKWANHKNLDIENEKYLYRFSVLKKRIWSVLYLSVRTKPLFSVQRQLGPMIAAGFAAFWAFVANIIIWNYLYFSGFKGFSTNQAVGIGGFLVLSAFVLAYILKDRIKEIGREKFKRGFFWRIPDTSEKIFYENSNNEKFDIGHIQEYTQFIGERGDLPLIIQEKLSSYEQFEGQKSNDTIIRYRKKIQLNANALKKQDRPIYGVHDVFRFNIRNLLSRLDDPTKSFLSISKMGEVERLDLPRVYHLDMVIRYSRQNLKGQMEHIAYDLRRLVINKDGLLRVEKISD